MFFNWVMILPPCPPGDNWEYLGMLSQLRLGVPLVGKAKAAAKHPTIHRTAPQHGILPCNIPPFLRVVRRGEIWAWQHVGFWKRREGGERWCPQGTNQAWLPSPHPLHYLDERPRPGFSHIAADVCMGAESPAAAQELILKF